MNSENWAAEDYLKLRNSGLNRSTSEFARHGIWLEGSGQTLLNFASNDYLQLADDPRVIEAARACLEDLGLGTGASRLLSGTTPIHEELEQALAEHFHLGSVALFSSGYLANIGFLSTAVSRHDFVISDKLVHASIIDGIRLSEAQHFRFRHNELEDAERLLRQAREQGRAKRILLVTESVFSMDGDLAPLEGLISLAEKYEAATFFDEAHALGVFGGTGLGRAQNLKKDFLGGTLSKSFGACGGFIGGNSELRSWLHSSARSFIFNTSIPAALCAGALAALKIASNESRRGEAVLQAAAFMRTLLEKQEVNCLSSESQIIPILIGNRDKAMLVSAELLKRGLYIPAIRPPTVKAGTERLRLSITYGMSEQILARAGKEIVAVLRQFEVVG